MPQTLKKTLVIIDGFPEINALDWNTDETD
jgi:hypothetical protein